ncbi:hypothetical protein BUALT_Bualt15G0123800 [Buddleja alternifolia]|uniref:Uncharacterized protein n=1 Tax=Buddleja alternifolia TaxID=168488 RepID=A0AAV6WGJ9_9LAMI|nr:hypothetical protein BUALT_Bualt15G0123800 [Buddleja alternifolia]
MVSCRLIEEVKLSSVVPATITGEDKMSHRLKNMDLLMKVHYITTVHFFNREAVEGLSIQDLKKPMFEWLDLYYPICGRIRRHHDGDGGRPYVKCNDSGVRIVEASCSSKTVDEWLESMDGGDHHRLLVYHQPLAHDLGFTPLVFLQFTKFKCGGLCVGMSWAHILGDAFSASKCINTWGNIFMPPNHTTLPPHVLHMTSTSPSIGHHLGTTSTFLPRSVKLLDRPSLGDSWFITPNNHSKMQMHTFHLKDIMSSSNFMMISKDHVNKLVEPFHVISAIIWISLSKIRGSISNSLEPNIVTIVANKKGFDVSDEMILGNTHQVIGIVEAQSSSVKDADPLELAKLIAEKFEDETIMIEKLLMEKENHDQNETIDFVVYGGANLTFVNFEQVDLYGLRVKRKGPVFANLSIGGVGDEGAVFVLPSGPEDGCGRIVNVILPEDQLQDLKTDLQVEWGIF